MGLDTTHDCWHGSYSAFHRWRVRVAAAAGINLSLMEGFFNANGVYGPERGFVKHLEDCGMPTFGIRWSSLAPSPLWVLLNHSDCEGFIEHKDCLPLAEALEALTFNFDYLTADHADREWTESKTSAFAEGLRAAHEAGEDVEFC